MHIGYTWHHTLQHTHTQNCALNTVHYIACISVYGACILYIYMQLCVVYIDGLARFLMCRLNICEHSAYLFVCLNCMCLNCIYSYKENFTCVFPAAVSCGPAPNAPLNGQRSGSGTTFRSTVNYTCDPGYTLQGDSIRTCMANRKWSGVTTLCSRKHTC